MDSLRKIIMSIDIDNLLAIFHVQIAIGVIIFFILFRTIFSRAVIKTYYTIIKKKKIAKDSSMYKSLNNFFLVLGIFIALFVLPFNNRIDFVIQKGFKLFVLFYLFKGITSLANEDSKIFKPSQDRAVNMFIFKIARIMIWLIYIFIVLKELGYDLTGVVAGLGIGSAAIALAAQDVVKSLISGLTIITDKPFSIGDWIEVGDYQGTVIGISYRSTRIKNANNAIVTIPNSVVTSTYILNWNKLTSRRFDCTLNLSLETNSEEIKKIVKQIKLVLENNSNIIPETVQVFFEGISNYSNNIKIFMYIKETNYEKYLKIKESILCDLLSLVEKENIDLAYPTQTLYLKKSEILEN